MKLGNPFPAELRTTAFVSRWNILWALQRDNVAQHSFFVAWYAYMIGQTIGWSGPYDYLLLKALEHDLDETITADITGPVKSTIVDKEKMEEYLEGRMRERMGGLIDHFYEIEDAHTEQEYQDVQKIVLAADMMDALLFLIVNEQMGNKAVHWTIEVLYKKFEAAWRALPAEKEFLSKTWQTVVLPAIAEHKVKGGRGI